MTSVCLYLIVYHPESKCVKKEKTDRCETKPDQIQTVAESVPQSCKRLIDTTQYLDKIEYNIIHQAVSGDILK